MASFIINVDIGIIETRKALTQNKNKNKQANKLQGMMKKIF